MGTNIRLSPSGPDLVNDAGAPFDPGTGARLRLAEGTTTLGSTTNVVTTSAQVIGVQLNATPAPIDIPLIASLTAPDPAKNYRATVLCDVINTLTTANITITLDIQSSVDGGTTWGAPIATALHQLGFSTDTNGGCRQVRCDATLRAGSAFGVIAGSPSLKVRARITGSIDGALVSHATGVTETGDGSALLQLEEMF